MSLPPSRARPPRPPRAGARPPARVNPPNASSRAGTVPAKRPSLPRTAIRGAGLLAALLLAGLLGRAATHAGRRAHAQDAHPAPETASLPPAPPAATAPPGPPQAGPAADPEFTTGPKAGPAAGAEGRSSGADGEARAPSEPDTRGDTFGTSVRFLARPAAAAESARRRGKLLFVLHVSGNFEESCFT
jgi:hypothetical protein